MRFHKLRENLYRIKFYLFSLLSKIYLPYKDYTEFKYKNSYKD